MSMNEADTRFHLIDPVLRGKGYVSRERVTLETVLTPPPVEPSGPKGRRRKGPDRTDYMLLRWSMDCSPDHRLKKEQYRLWVGDPLALYGVENANLAPGYQAPSSSKKR